jgi:hypothetical protein
MFATLLVSHFLITAVSNFKARKFFIREGRQQEKKDETQKLLDQ